MTGERENLGVKVYELQKRLTDLQCNLEVSRGAHAGFEGERTDAERHVAQLKLQEVSSQRESAEMNSKVTEQQRVLERLNSLLRSLYKYNKDMHDRVRVSRRAAYKSEQQVTERETARESADELVEKLGGRILRVREEQKVLSAQIAGQSAETELARGTLSKVEGELEALQYEKQQLVGQWKSTLHWLSRRDQETKVLEDTIEHQNEELVSSRMELEGLVHRIRGAREEHEKVSSSFSRVQTELTLVTRKSTKFDGERTRLGREYQVVGASVKLAEDEGLRVEQDRKRAVVAQKAAEKASRGLEAQVAELRRLIMISEQEAVASNKNATTSVSNIRKVRKRLGELEMSIAGIENELARVRVDSLHIARVNSGLSKESTSLNSELSRAQSLIDQYEVEIRRRNDFISKKQSSVDKLNRKYEALVSRMEDESTGPLEAEVNNLTKSINKMVRQCRQLQQLWLRRQAELVSCTKKLEAQREAMSDLASRHTVLVQKKMRLRSGMEGRDGEVKVVRREIDKAHHFMTKLNTIISEQKVRLGVLGEENLSVETKFVETLQLLEADAHKLEEATGAANTARAATMAGLTEAHRQVLFWEKKIKISKETHQVLDPKVGTAEICEMKKEIRRMELKNSKLVAQVTDTKKMLEKALERRATIEQKARLRARSGGGGGGLTGTSNDVVAAALSGKLTYRVTGGRSRKGGGDGGVVVGGGPGGVSAAVRKLMRDVESGEAEVITTNKQITRLRDNIDAMRGKLENMAGVYRVGTKRRERTSNLLLLLRCSRFLMSCRRRSSTRLHKWYTEAEHSRYDHVLRGNTGESSVQFRSALSKLESRMMGLLHVCGEYLEARPDLSDGIVPVARAIRSNLLARGIELPVVPGLLDVGEGGGGSIMANVEGAAEAVAAKRRTMGVPDVEGVVGGDGGGGGGGGGGGEESSTLNIGVRIPEGQVAALRAETLSTVAEAGLTGADVAE